MMPQIAILLRDTQISGCDISKTKKAEWLALPSLVYNCLEVISCIAR